MFITVLQGWAFRFVHPAGGLLTEYSLSNIYQVWWRGLRHRRVALLVMGRDGTKMNQTDTCQQKSSNRSLCFRFLLHFVPLFIKHTSHRVHTCTLYSVTTLSTELLREDSGSVASSWPELERQWVNRGWYALHTFKDSHRVDVWATQRGKKTRISFSSSLSPRKIKEWYYSQITCIKRMKKSLMETFFVLLAYNNLWLFRQ